MARYTVLAVDDETKILETIQAYLARAGYQTLCARSGSQAQRILRENAVSLVLLDLMLPDVSGEEICARIREGFYPAVRKDTPVIMITAKAGEANVVRGLNMGADDYITKPFSPRELIARAAALLRRSAQGGGGGYEKETPLVVGDLVIDRENHLVKKNGEALSLTANEYRIFTLLASRPQKIFTRDEIIEAVKEEDFDGFDRAVDSHIKNLRKKLDDDRHKYIVTVYGMGYRVSGGRGDAL